MEPIVETISVEQEPTLTDILGKVFHGRAPEDEEVSLKKASPKNTSSLTPSLSSEPQLDLPEDKLSSLPETDWQDLYEKSQTSYKETQKWGQDLSRKLKSFEKRVQKLLVDDADLTPNEAKELLEDMVHEEPTSNSSPLTRYGEIWDKELSNMRKYVDDKNIDQNVLAFQHFLQYGDKQDIESVLQGFEELADDEIALTRKMLELGRQYNADIFDSFSQAGSLKNWKKNYDESLEKAQKKIDDLEKKLLKYEVNKEDNSVDYLPSKTYRLPNGGGQEAPRHLEQTLGGILDGVKYGNLFGRL